MSCVLSATAIPLYEVNLAMPGRAAPSLALPDPAMPCPATPCRVYDSLWNMAIVCPRANVMLLSCSFDSIFFADLPEANNCTA